MKLLLPKSKLAFWKEERNQYLGCTGFQKLKNMGFGGGGGVGRGVQIIFGRSVKSCKFYFPVSEYPFSPLFWSAANVPQSNGKP